MSKKILKLTMLAVLAILASGCSATYKTKVSPPGKYIHNGVKIEVDQDATNFSYTGNASVMRVNYKYALAVAAKTTLDRGFKYFSIDGPRPLMDQLKDRNVTNIEEAYYACDSGDGSFRMYLSVESGFDDFKGRRAKNCDNIIFGWRESVFNGGANHRYVRLAFEMHNEDKNNNLTFNAKEVLESDFMKDLNPAYFVNMTR